MALQRYSDLVDQLLALPGSVRLVSIDGPGGAGKSTFARRLAAARPSVFSVVHTDDFASADVPVEWWPRLLDGVIRPLVDGHEGRFQRYDWATNQLADWCTVPRSPIVLIEGVSAGRMEWDEHLAFRIWIETASDVRLERGLERDGPEAREQWEIWMAAEDKHFDRDASRHRAALIVDANCAAPYDHESEFAMI